MNNPGIRIHATGGPEQLGVEDLPVPAPARGEVVVRHRAIGVNFLDCYHRSGRYPLAALPSGIGSEGVGVVEAVGDGVDRLLPGARVAYAGGVAPGAYCRLRAVPAWRLVPVPDAVDDATAAAVLLKGLTAEFLVRRLFRVGPGHRALVHAAAGGVGLLLCQWLRHLGATVFGVVSTRAKAEVAAAHGCHHAIVSGEEDFVAAVRAITKDKGVDVVYDSVGEATMRGSMQCCKRRGTVVSYGNSSGAPAPIAPADLMRAGSLFLTRPSLVDYTATRQELLRAAAVVFDHVAAKVLRPHVHAVMPLAAAAAAHRLLEARATIGSLVLVP